MNKKADNCEKLLNKRGCCGRFVGGDFGLFSSKQGCLKSDNETEKIILQELESKSSGRVFVEDMEDNQDLQARIKHLTEEIKQAESNCEDCSAEDVCEENRNVLLSKQPRVLIFVALVSIGLLGKFIFYPSSQRHFVSVSHIHSWKIYAE